MWAGGRSVGTSTPAETIRGEGEGGGTIEISNISGIHMTSYFYLELTPHNLVQVLCKVADVVRVQSRHRNPSVHRQVDVRLVRQRLALLSADPRKTALRHDQQTPRNPPASTYLNIPIWFTMWSQFPGVFSSSVSNRRSSRRMAMIRPAMVRMSCFHSSNSAASFRISDICHLPSALSIMGTTTYHPCAKRGRIADFAPL